MFSSMDVSDVPHILSDDRIVTAIRAIIRQELARALDVQQKDKLLTVDEAAEMLSLAVPTVYKLVNQNKIPFMKRTKRLHFSIDSYACQNEPIPIHREGWQAKGSYCFSGTSSAASHLEFLLTAFSVDGGCSQSFWKEFIILLVVTKALYFFIGMVFL